MTQNCILDGYKRGGCASCPTNCQHRISLEGLNGKGGRVSAAKVPSEYRNITLKNSPVRTSQTEFYDVLDGYVATFERQFDENGERIKSWYLWSESPGTGKTSTATALANEYIIRHYYGSVKRGIQPIQRPAYFHDVNAWQELYTGFTRPGIPKEIAEANSRPYYTQMELAKHTPFVVLDDIGVRSASEGFRGDLHSVINYRVSNGLTTVYTSNLPLISPVKMSDRIQANKPYDMVDVFDARLADRMRDMCGVWHYEGKSKRGKR